MDQKSKLREQISRANGLIKQISAIRIIRDSPEWGVLTAHVSQSLVLISKSLLTKELSPYNMGKLQGEYLALQRFVSSDEDLVEKEAALCEQIAKAEAKITRIELMSYKSPVPGGKL